VGRGRFCFVGEFLSTRGFCLFEGFVEPSNLHLRVSGQIVHEGRWVVSSDTMVDLDRQQFSEKFLTVFLRDGTQKLQ
jgi:hypothetical protein